MLGKFLRKWWLLGAIGSCALAPNWAEGSSLPQEPRDYYAPLSPSDEHNIRYLIGTMAEKSPVALWLFHRQALEKAGRETVHIHPLSFLKFVLTDSKLRYQVRQIKSAPWNRFQKYFVRSLRAAHKRDNLGTEVMEDFADATGISRQMMEQSIVAEDWPALTNTVR